MPFSISFKNLSFEASLIFGLQSMTIFIIYLLSIIGQLEINPFPKQQIHCLGWREMWGNIS